MPDLFDLIARWWKQMLLVMLLSLGAVGVITFIKPRKYLSVATAVPASSYSSDKARVFNNNIQSLYSTLGTPDDLDMILGTANLDTVYIAVAKHLQLSSFYKMKEEGEAANMKAASLLRADSKVMKSEYGELKVKVWSTDNKTAAAAANAILETLDDIHRELQSKGNLATLNSLARSRSKAQQDIDSVKKLIQVSGSAFADTSYLNSRNRLLSDYAQKISEYQLLIDNKPPVLLPVEEAKPSSWPDKPKRMQIMIATAILALLFSLLAALLLERRKKSLA